MSEENLQEYGFSRKHKKIDRDLFVTGRRLFFGYTLVKTT
jgi:hypothetical protein